MSAAFPSRWALQNCSNSAFVEVRDIPIYLKTKYAASLTANGLQALEMANLLPIFVYGSEKYVPLQNLEDFKYLLNSLAEPYIADLLNWRLACGTMPFTLAISDTTDIALPDGNPRDKAVFYSALHNLVQELSEVHDSETNESVDIPFVSGTRIRTGSQIVRHIAERKLARASLCEDSNASIFANSAYYMGSKKTLAAFLVEAISSVLPEEGIVVDLMCGSGAASGAFSKVWSVYASDAQEFCRVLARIQGKGFSLRRAKVLISKLMPIVRDHAEDLSARIAPYLKLEDRIFHSNIDRTLLAQYHKYMVDFPLFPEGKASNAWDPTSLVERRKANRDIRPYCLFTTYFANHYFGLRQCVEIDSLRYAIDKTSAGDARTWALGSLVTALSALGSAYGAHFAQPIEINENNIIQILERRAQSVVHEFCVRLLNLSTVSAESPHEITVLPGPWQSTLQTLGQLRLAAPVVVYLDAPYSRDEYSRYYHVLETAIAYSYPSSTGRGRTPDKKKGERFNSEFFTKDRNKLQGTFVRIITEILARGWFCAWSYASSGSANALEVISTVIDKSRCTIKVYCAPHTHKAQGRGSKAKVVSEYLVIFLPPK